MTDDPGRPVPHHGSGGVSVPAQPTAILAQPPITTDERCPACGKRLTTYSESAGGQKFVGVTCIPCGASLQPLGPKQERASPPSDALGDKQR
jgi:hypothetical protein